MQVFSNKFTFLKETPKFSVLQKRIELGGLSVTEQCDRPTGELRDGLPCDSPPAAPNPVLKYTNTNKKYTNTNKKHTNTNIGELKDGLSCNSPPPAEGQQGISPQMAETPQKFHARVDWTQDTGHRWTQDN